MAPQGGQNVVLVRARRCSIPRINPIEPFGLRLREPVATLFQGIATREGKREVIRGDRLTGLQDSGDPIPFGQQIPDGPFRAILDELRCASEVSCFAAGNLNRSSADA
jgi:hypothetical protein